MSSTFIPAAPREVVCVFFVNMDGRLEEIHERVIAWELVTDDADLHVYPIGISGRIRPSYRNRVAVIEQPAGTFEDWFGLEFRDRGDIEIHLRNVNPQLPKDPAVAVVDEVHDALRRSDACPDGLRAAGVTTSELAYTLCHLRGIDPTVSARHRIIKALRRLADHSPIAASYVVCRTPLTWAIPAEQL